MLCRPSQVCTGSMVCPFVTLSICGVVSMDGASSPVKLAAVPPPSVTQSATASSLVAEAVQKEAAESDTHMLSSYSGGLPLQKSKTMPEVSTSTLCVVPDGSYITEEEGYLRPSCLFSSLVTDTESTLYCWACGA